MFVHCLELTPRNSVVRFLIIVYTILRHITANNSLKNVHRSRVWMYFITRAIDLH